MKFFRRLRFLLHRDELAEEMRVHQEMRREDGLPEAGFGSDLALRARSREAWGGLWLEDTVRDVGMAGRMLRRRPGFTAIAVVTLALGIGATTAMFSVVRTVILNPLPYSDVARLVKVEAATSRPHGRAFPELPAAAIRALLRAGIFSGLAVKPLSGGSGSVYLDGFVVDADVQHAAAGFFATLGVPPALGRGFNGAGNEAVVSQPFFKHFLHGNRAALGRPLRVGNRWYTVVGVLPATLTSPVLYDVWLGGAVMPGGYGSVFARLRPGGSAVEARARAQAAVTALGAHLAHGPRFSGLTLAPFVFPGVAAKTRTALWALLAAAACLLLIASGNTANLLLARGLERRHELEMRRALGASRARLVRLVLAEGGWLALIGGAAGVGLAWVLVRLARLGPAGIPRLQAASLSAPVLGAAAALAVLSGLACALAPALRLARDPGQPIPRTQRLRSLLVASEVALTLALLIGCVLLARSLLNMENVNLGFDPHQVTEVRVLFPSTPAHADMAALRPRRVSIDQALRKRLRALPGVVAAGYGSVPLFSWHDYNAEVSLPGGHAPKILARFLEAGAGYFSTLGIRLLAGRGFTADELEGFGAKACLPNQPCPAVINAALAHRLWPGRGLARAVGAQLAWDTSGAAVVVGVVGDVSAEPGAPPPPAMYGAVDGRRDSGLFFLRSALPPATVAAEVRRAAAPMDAGLSVSLPVRLEDTMAAALVLPRYRTLLMGVFAALAWALALAGLYGVLAFEVRRRRLEIGIRIAFGAGDHDVLRLIVGQSLMVLAAGIGAGWLLAWVLARSIASLLFGVSALDPATWLGAGAALLAAGLLASWIPAQHALGVNAAETLRCE